MEARFNTLEEWLLWQESLHWTTIDFGLDRLREVASKLQIIDDLPFTIITVGGTNGKGSTVAMLDAMLQSEGYQTGTYTSPYLYRYNERIKILGEECSDELICDAFAAIDKTRGDISLTYFEFATLAAMWIFKQQSIQVALLEVGMGGRLDAVNLWDANAAIITSIGVDHVQWLGDNREDIGYEKSGIMRESRPVISGDLNPPQSIAAQAEAKGAKLLQAGKNFFWKTKISSWHFSTLSEEREDYQKTLELPYPALQGDFQVNNAAVAIAALQSLSSLLEVSTESISTGLKQVKLAGRLEQIQHSPDVILDVAHNAHAAKELAKWLSDNPIQGKTFALFSMLADKDIGQVVQIMAPVINQWFVSSVDDPRGLSAEDLVVEMQSIIDQGSHGCGKNATEKKIVITSYNTLKTAWEKCKPEVNNIDRVIVFGSFLVLSEFKVIY